MCMPQNYILIRILNRSCKILKPLQIGNSHSSIFLSLTNYFLLLLDGTERCSLL